MNNNEKRIYNVLKKYKVVSIVHGMLIFKDEGFKGIVKKIKSKRTNNASAVLSQKEMSKKSKSLVFNSGKINIVFETENLYDEYNGFIDLKIKYNLFIISTNNKTDIQCISNQDFYSYFEERSFIFVTTRKVLNGFEYCFLVNSIDKFKTTIEDIENNLEYFKLFANYEPSNTITAKAATFFNYEGTNYYSGGAERYLMDLYDVCNGMGFDFDIYQNANKPYFRKYRNINVIGMYNRESPLNYSFGFLESQSKKYINMTYGKSILHILSAFQEGYPNKISPSIGISHGISWDNPQNKAIDGNNFWLSKKIFIDSALKCDKLVSVDTNTANWFQTIDYELGNQKIKVITNYVDTNEFCKDDTYKRSDKIVITYPRRLYEPRGMYLLLDIVDEIFEKYNNVEIHFVGKGFDEDVKHISDKIAKYPDRLFCYSKEPEKMNEVYKMSDISLVPTLYSEGTSLSCLEALSSENIVICTRIGGLTDLIINGLNGYQIEPNKESLLETIEFIIDNIDKQNKIRKNARDTALAFNKELWKIKWAHVIKSFNLKGNSKNIGLVEFYVKDINKVNQNVLSLIKQELLANNLVYIRSKKKVKNDIYSCGLLQLIDYDEEVVSKADVLYIQKGLLVDRDEKRIEI